MNTYERIYNILVESAISKEVKETPGSDMMLARSQIDQGLYSGVNRNKKASKKHGKKASTLIAKARQKRGKK
tara:strand:+ start:2319 stop:2534 length:216 start_codon:yes stop_codon:yes gene_type:complete